MNSGDCEYIYIYIIYFPLYVCIVATKKGFIVVMILVFLLYIGTIVNKRITALKHVLIIFFFKKNGSGMSHFY